MASSLDSAKKHKQRNPCDTYKFQERMILAADILKGYYPKDLQRPYNQMNFVQALDKATDSMGNKNMYEVVTESEVGGESGRVAISEALHSIVAKTAGGGPTKHSEQFVINHRGAIEQAQGDNARTLIILSTYSPCGKCGAREQIQKLCNGEETVVTKNKRGKDVQSIEAGKKPRYKKCVYLYGVLWTEQEGANEKSSPPTPKGWDGVLKKAGIDVYKCNLLLRRTKSEPNLKIKGLDLAQSQYVDFMTYDDGYSSYEEYTLGTGNNYDYRYSAYPYIDYSNYNDGALVDSLVVGIGAVAIFGVCCLFMLLLGCFAGYGIGRKLDKFVDQDVNDNDNLDVA